MKYFEFEKDGWIVEYISERTGLFFKTPFNTEIQIYDFQLKFLIFDHIKLLTEVLDDKTITFNYKNIIYIKLPLEVAELLLNKLAE